MMPMFQDSDVFVVHVVIENPAQMLLISQQTQDPGSYLRILVPHGPIEEARVKTQ